MGFPFACECGCVEHRNSLENGELCCPAARAAPLCHRVRGMALIIASSKHKREPTSKSLSDLFSFPPKDFNHSQVFVREKQCFRTGNSALIANSTHASVPGIQLLSRVQGCAFLTFVCGLSSAGLYRCLNAAFCIYSKRASSPLSSARTSRLWALCRKMTPRERNFPPLGDGRCRSITGAAL